MQANQLTNRQVFEKVFPDAIKNVIWYGCAIGVIVVISKVSWWFGIVLAGVYALVTTLDTLRVAFVAVLGLIAIPVNVVEKLRGQYYEEDFGYMIAGLFVQIIETIISGIYIYILYRNFFPD